MSSYLSATDCNTIAEQAIALMRERSIPLSPANYAIWFEYFAGTNPELKALGDRLLGQDTPVADDVSTWLYETFAPEPAERRKLLVATDTVSATVGEVMAQLAHVGQDAAAYGKVLETYETVLEDGGTGPGTAQTLKALFAATRRMHAENSKLESQLVSSTHRITELQGTLETVKREATTDPLTGLANRRAFDQFLEEAMDTARSSDTHLSLLMIDVDHFKRFNDTYGHQIGDEVLRLVARTLTDTIKGRDFAARHGGEEFAILLPDTALAQAMAVGEQVRAAMASRRIVRRNSGVDYGQVTLSIGISVMQHEDEAKTLIGRADRALYAAKAAGRNRVLAEGSVAATPTADPAIRTAPALA